MVLGSVKELHSFTCDCPVFQAPLIEEAIFAPLYILAPFVKSKIRIGAWVHFWAFYLVPLVYISVFVPVPYRLDDCKSSVILDEVRFYTGAFWLAKLVINVARLATVL